MNQLTRTGWARRSDDLESCARALGVQPDVLREAREQYGRRPRAETAALCIKFPEVVFKHWRAVASAQKLESALLMRGLIEALLLGGRLPTWAGRFWFFRGKKYDITIPQGTNWPWKVYTEISRGADRALEDIARVNKTTKTALVRGQVLDYLEGKTHRVVLLNSSAMAGDSERYLRLWGL